MKSFIFDKNSIRKFFYISQKKLFSSNTYHFTRIREENNNMWVKQKLVIMRCSWKINMVNINSAGSQFKHLAINFYRKLIFLNVGNLD